MPSLIGQTIGQYRIESLLGTGGMGEVYRGIHVLLDRPAAVKVLHANMATDPSFQARFRQEAKAAASLNHPNIVEIYDFGVQGDLYFLVMELLSDGSLRTLLAKGRKKEGSLGLGLDLVRQAAEGLSYAHTRGMVHRDIKPDNLLLSALPANTYTVKVSDFGLARLAEGGVQTMTGVTMGTPAYMSPEQCQGWDLDGRSDLYSLGVVLYEVATGYLPFDAKTLSAAVYKHVHTPPPPPSSVKRDLPAEVEKIILRLLAKNPADRYTSGADVAEALQTVLINLGFTPSKSTLPTAAQPVQTIPWIPAQEKPRLEETVLQPPGAQNTPPPAQGSGSLSSINLSSVPRLRIQDADGKTLKVVNLNGEGVTMGRSPDNTISLDSQNLSRHHLRMDWDGNRVTVTDLGSSNGTLFEGKRLPAQVPHVWDGKQPLHVGPFWVRLEPPLAGTAVASAAGGNSLRGRIGVSLESEPLKLTPGQPAVCRLTLANLGDTSDLFDLTVEGIPGSWVQGAGQGLLLEPGSKLPVSLTIVPPRSADSQAGDAPVAVRVRSRSNPDEWGVAHQTWRLLPFAAMQLSIAPKSARGSKGADYVLNLRNTGNAPAAYTLRGSDDGQKLSYRFASNGQTPQANTVVSLNPGTQAQINLQVSAGSRLVGGAQTRDFKIQAAPPAGAAPESVSGQFVQTALLPIWVPALALLLLVALGVGLYSFVNKPPTIQSYTFDPDPPKAGEKVTVRWRVANAENVELQPLGILVPASAGQYTFDNGLPPNTPLTLVASNTFGRANQALALNIVTPTATPTAQATPTTEAGAPQVAFTANDKSDPQVTVFAGDTFVLKWKATNADSVQLLPGGNRPLEGQESFTAANDTTFTLVARNSDGKATPRTIQIIVKPNDAATQAAGATQTVMAQTVAAQTAAAQTAAIQAAIQAAAAGTQAAVNANNANNTAAAAQAAINANNTAVAGTRAANNATGTAQAKTATALAVPSLTFTPTPTPAPVVVYDLIARANSITWVSGPPDGFIPFNGSDVDNRGFVLYRDNATLNSGAVAARALETHPKWVANGYIKGCYNFAQTGYVVQEKDHLLGSIGFLSGAGAGNVIFHITMKANTASVAPEDTFMNVVPQVTLNPRLLEPLALPTGILVQPLLTRALDPTLLTAIAIPSVPDAIYTQSLKYADGVKSFDVPLKNFAGKKVDFCLRVDAGTDAGQDWATWQNVRIMR